jgi:hypothetical protein
LVSVGSEEDVLWKEWWLRKERLRCSPPAPTTKNVAMFNVEFAGKIRKEK